MRFATSETPLNPEECMSSTESPAVWDSIAAPSEFQLLGSQLAVMRHVLRTVLSQPAGQSPDQWRRSVLHNLRVLTCSDMAILTLRDPSGLRVYGDQVSQELLSSYTNHFADLDRGRRAACDFGLEVWNL